MEVNKCICFCAIFLITCNSPSSNSPSSEIFPLSRYDDLEELEENFTKNKNFFYGLEKKFLKNIDVINAKFNDESLYDSIEKKTGMFIFSIDFYRDSLCNKIYISTGSWNSSGYMFFSNSQELNCMLKYTNQLKKENSTLVIKIKKMSSHWIAFNKNKEAPLDVLFYNNIPESRICYQR